MLTRCAYCPRRSTGIAKRSLSPNSTQQVTIGVIGAYAVVIGILWHIPVLSKVLWPFKEIGRAHV